MLRIYEVTENTNGFQIAEGFVVKNFPDQQAFIKNVNEQDNPFSFNSVRTEEVHKKLKNPNGYGVLVFSHKDDPKSEWIYLVTSGSNSVSQLPLGLQFKLRNLEDQLGFMVRVTEFSKTRCVILLLHKETPVIESIYRNNNGVWERTESHLTQEFLAR